MASRSTFTPEKLKRFKAVGSVEREHSGYWIVHLAEGYGWENSHFFDASTLEQCRSIVKRFVGKCKCKECLPTKAYRDSQYAVRFVECRL